MVISFFWGLYWACGHCPDNGEAHGKEHGKEGVCAIACVYVLVEERKYMEAFSGCIYVYGHMCMYRFIRMRGEFSDTCYMCNRVLILITPPNNK